MGPASSNFIEVTHAVTIIPNAISDTDATAKTLQSISD